jgi:hypothetical protein
VSCDTGISPNSVLFHLRNQISLSQKSRSLGNPLNNLWICHDYNLVLLKIRNYLITSVMPSHYFKEAWSDQNSALKFKCLTSWIKYNCDTVIGCVRTYTSKERTCNELIDTPFTVGEFPTCGSFDWSDWRVVSRIVPFLRSAEPVF